MKLRPFHAVLGIIAVLAVRRNLWSRLLPGARTET